MHPYAQKWRQAEEVEIDSLENMGAWARVPRSSVPTGEKVYEPPKFRFVISFFFAQISRNFRGVTNCAVAHSQDPESQDTA